MIAVPVPHGLVKAIYASVASTIDEIPADNPSKPSIKLIAFVIPTSQNTVIG
ncbi:Uncharacterised protein [Streptococcus pneumoniae]|nr:Uncharacterised protein [Streptococcus pneumoniae]